MIHRAVDQEASELSRLDQRVKLFKSWANLHSLDTPQPSHRGDVVFRRPDERYAPPSLGEFKE